MMQKQKKKKNQDRRTVHKDSKTKAFDKYKSHHRDIQAKIPESPREELTITITDIAYLGAGVGRHEGCVVFVPKTCLGEEVRVRVLRRKKAFIQAKLCEVLKPAPERLAEPLCYAPVVTYAHMTYEGEIAMKQRQLENFLVRMANIDPVTVLQPPVASPMDLHYRNKIVFHAGEQKGFRTLGYLGVDNTTVQDTAQCALACPEINTLITKLRGNDKFMKRLATEDKVTFRYTPKNGACYWVNQEVPNIVLTEDTVLGELSVHAGGFFQINLAAANLLLEAFKTRFADESVPKRTVIDLYCGVGLFSIAAAQAGAQHVLGIEHNSGAIASARKNAAAHKIHATFSCADTVSLKHEQLTKVPSTEMTLIVDPPREGLADDVIQTILSAPPKKLFYISCGPDTLMRDLKKLQAGGYHVDYVQLFDLFPRTPHFETLVELTLEG